MSSLLFFKIGLLLLLCVLTCRSQFLAIYSGEVATSNGRLFTIQVQFGHIDLAQTTQASLFVEDCSFKFGMGTSPVEVTFLPVNDGNIARSSIVVFNDDSRNLKGSDYCIVTMRNKFRISQSRVAADKTFNGQQVTLFVPGYPADAIQLDSTRVLFDGRQYQSFFARNHPVGVFNWPFTWSF